MGKIVDIKNQRFGRLIALNISTERPSNKGCFWTCSCDCGKIIIVASNSLRRGKTLSCGCYHSDMMKNQKYTQKSAGEHGFNGLYKNYKASALVRKLEFSLSKEDFKKLTKQNCHYCGQEPNQLRKAHSGSGMTTEAEIHGSYIYNGIDRVNNKIGYLSNNCVTCCKTCNIAKRDLSSEEFVSWIFKTAENLKKVLNGQ